MFCKFEKKMIMGITFHWTNNLRQRRYYKGFNHHLVIKHIKTDSPHIRIFTWQFYCDLKITSHFIWWIVFCALLRISWGWNPRSNNLSLQWTKQTSLTVGVLQSTYAQSIIARLERGSGHQVTFSTIYQIIFRWPKI